MNPCRTEGHSCVACCGLFNLVLSDADLHSLLLNRTEEWERLDVTNPAELMKFRMLREREESKIARRQIDIYVCPFVGYPPYEQESKPLAGCLIHPALTGKSDSQSVSFYGMSVCGSYDCTVKDMDNGSHLSLIQWFATDRGANQKTDRSRFLYSRSYPDRMLFDFLERMRIHGRLKDPLPVENRFENRKLYGIIRSILHIRSLSNTAMGMSSFEMHRQLPDGVMAALRVLFMDIDGLEIPPEGVWTNRIQDKEIDKELLDILNYFA